MENDHGHGTQRTHHFRSTTRCQIDERISFVRCVSGIIAFHIKRLVDTRGLNTIRFLLPTEDAYGIADAYIDGIGIPIQIIFSELRIAG